MSTMEAPSAATEWRPLHPLPNMHKEGCFTVHAHQWGCELTLSCNGRRPAKAADHPFRANNFSEPRGQHAHNRDLDRARGQG
jgi:hypothetical protein